MAGEDAQAPRAASEQAMAVEPPQPGFEDTQEPGEEMDEIEKELESLIDEELKLEAERLVKQRVAAEAADAALRELEAAKKPEPAKRSLDDVSTEVGSTATLETGPSKKSRVVHEEVLDQRPQEVEDPQLAQQRLELNRLEEESRNLQRLLQQKQEELLLEKQRQEHEEVARLRREAEEQKAREAAEKKARGEAEQRALAKAAAGGGTGKAGAGGGSPPCGVAAKA